MSSLNRVFLMGNLTRDPELRYTPKGTAVAELGMAINSSFRTQDGVEKEEVLFVDIETWGRQAETSCQYLKKGSPLFVEGRLQLDQWQDKDGSKRSKLRVRAERVQFLGSGSSGGGGGGNYRRSEMSDAAPSEERERPPQRSSGGYSGGGSGGGSRRPAPAARPEPTEEPPMDGDDDIPF